MMERKDHLRISFIAASPLFFIATEARKTRNSFTSQNIYYPAFGGIKNSVSSVLPWR
jgi:hypothetical protein